MLFLASVALAVIDERPATSVILLVDFKQPRELLASHLPNDLS